MLASRFLIFGVAIAWMMGLSGGAMPQVAPTNGPSARGGVKFSRVRLEHGALGVLQGYSEENFGHFAKTLALVWGNLTSRDPAELLSSLTLTAGAHSVARTLRDGACIVPRHSFCRVGGQNERHRFPSACTRARLTNHPRHPTARCRTRPTAMHSPPPEAAAPARRNSSCAPTACVRPGPGRRHGRAGPPRGLQAGGRALGRKAVRPGARHAQEPPLSIPSPLFDPLLSPPLPSSPLLAPPRPSSPPSCPPRPLLAPRPRARGRAGRGTTPARCGW